jgi:hypothetical protein
MDNGSLISHNFGLWVAILTEFVGFGAMDNNFRWEVIGFGALDEKVAR